MNLRTLLFGPPEPALWPIHDEASAVKVVRALGYTVIKTPPGQIPRRGELWVPTRGSAEARWVRSIGDDQMSYALQRDGWPITIDMVTWHRWVRRTRAVRG